MSREHFFSTENLQSWWQDFSQTLGVALLGERQNQTEFSEHSSKHSIWRVDHYIKRFSREAIQVGKEQAWDNMQALFYEDARHHALESLIGELDTSFFYTVQDCNSGAGQYGEVLGGGYNEDLILMARHYVDMIAREGRDLDRVSLEEQVLLAEAAWALQTADIENEYILWFSPPGREEDGYHGSDNLETGDWDKAESHHSFFYLKNAKRNQSGDVTIYTRQLRAWPNIKQLLEIYRRLSGGRVLDLDPEKPDHSFIQNVLRLKIMADLQSGESPNMDKVVEAVKNVIYASQNEWAIKPNELPIINEAHFWVLQQELYQNFYLATLKPLFMQIPQNLDENSEFWRSKEYGQIIEQSDKAFSYYVLSLEKWVQDNNSNPNYRPRIRFKNLWQYFKVLPFKLAAKKQKPAEQITAEKLKFLYHVDVEQTIFDRKVPISDKLLYFRMAGSFLSLFKGFLSLAQCGVLAPFTMPLSIMRMAGSPGQFAQQISFMSYAQRRIFFKELNNMEQVSLGGEKWLVPKNYLLPRADGSSGCMLKSMPVVEAGSSMIKEVAVGPCDVPLAEDDFAIPMANFSYMDILQASLVEGKGSIGDNGDTNSGGKKESGMEDHPQAEQDNGEIVVYKRCLTLGDMLAGDRGVIAKGKNKTQAGSDLSPL